MAELTKNPNLTSAVKNPKESFVKAVTHYQTLGSGAVLTKAQYLEILIPEMLETLQRITAVSYSQLSPKTCSSFLGAWKNYAGMCILMNRMLRIIKFVNKSRSGA